jgi:hypothetical protein
LRRRGVQKLDAMGWSCGTTIVAGFATEQPAKIERPVLYAPSWIYRGAAAQSGGKMGAYRSVTIEQARERWLNGVPEDKKDTLIPTGWFDAWQKATWSTDPNGNAQNPPVLRAPNGVAEDFQTYWRSGKPTYDPARISVPTFASSTWPHARRLRWELAGLPRSLLLPFPARRRLRRWCGRAFIECEGLLNGLTSGPPVPARSRAA